MRTLMIMCIATLLLFACKPVEKDEQWLSPTGGVSREQVVAIATKYNLQDSIAEGYVSPYFKPFPPEAYSALSAEFWESYFAQWRKFSDGKNEFLQFRKELAGISSMAEYYQVIEKYPKQYEVRVKGCGGIDAYNQHKSEHLNGNFHIYLNQDGSISIIPGETDKGTNPGKRLDKAK